MQTSPKHWLDFILWPLLRLVWEPFSLKQSHWWHWLPYNGDPGFDLIIDGNRNAPRRRDNWLACLLETNFGWQTVVVIEPKTHTGAYRLGYYATESRRTAEGQIVKEHREEICTLILRGKCAGLIGPDDVFFFAFSYPEGKPIELKMVTVTTKARLTRDTILV